MNRLKKSGFTIVELLVVVAIIALLIAILLPAIGRARDAALVTQSLGNLRNMSAACVAYGADYNDRQYTAIPDEIGLYGNYCQAACLGLTATQCMPQMILGWDNNGGLWGYWCRGTPQRCSSWPSSCAQNMTIYVACDYWGSCGGRWLGSWRLPNCKAFNSYVSGRYYDKVFWAPKDTVTLANVEKYFQMPVEFSYDQVNYAEPTYCWSPAAMWSPDVLSWSRRAPVANPPSCAPACIGPPPTQAAMPGAYKSPAAGLAAYPSLKWRMWEHQWLQNREGGDTNPAFSTPTPWFFNHGYNSAPAVLCFDGHTQIVSMVGIMQDNDLACAQSAGGNAAVSSQSSGPLWFGCNGGPTGYYNNAAYDMLVTGQGAVNAGVLTVNGILGRDMLRIGD